MSAAVDLSFEELEALASEQAAASRHERAHDEAIASLRSAGLARALVLRTTGLHPADGTNFDTAVEYVHTNLRYHRFADMGANEFAVRAAYEDVFELLECHASHSKASSIRSLCRALCEPKGATSWAWKPAHGNLKNGIAALAMLYWLSNSSQMIRSPASAAPARPLSAPRARSDNTMRAPTLEPVHWGYSDGEEEEEEEEEEEDTQATEKRPTATGSVALSMAVAAAETTGPAGPAEDLAGTAGAVDVVQEGQAGGASSPCTPDWASQHATRAHSLGYPPARLRLDLLLGGSSAATWKASHASSAPPIGAPPLGVAPLLEDATGEALCHLRLLREGLRALAGVSGSEWRVHAGAADALCGAARGSSSVLGAPARQPVTLDQAASRPLLLTQPTALTSATPLLEEFASTVARLRAFTSAISARTTAPSVLHALCDAVSEELQPLSAFLWSIDDDARAAQQMLCSGARRHLNDRPLPSMLSLMHALRRGHGGQTAATAAHGGVGGTAPAGTSAGSLHDGSGGSGGGWMRKLGALDTLRQQLSAHQAIAGLIRGTAPLEEHDAAIAASHTIDTLLSLGAYEQLLGGDVTGDVAGDAPGDTSDETAADAAGHVLSAMSRAGQFGMAHHVSSPAASSTARIGMGADLHVGAAFGAATLLPMWLRLLVASLTPYLRALDRWLLEGRLHDLTGELPFTRNERVPVGDAEVHWRHGFHLRPPEAIPAVLRPFSRAMLQAGKSRHLLSRMPSLVHARPAEDTSPLHSIFCATMLRALQQSALQAQPRPPQSSQKPPAAVRPDSSLAAVEAERVDEALPALGHDSCAPLHRRRDLLPSTRPDASAARTAPRDEAALRSMAALGSLACLPSTPPERSPAERLLNARSGQCFLPTSLRGTGDDGALDELLDAIGGSPAHRANRTSGDDARHVCLTSLGLPPLAVLIHSCLVRPIQARSRAAGPLLLDAVSAYMPPAAAASLLHRVTLFAEPRLTAPVFEDLFSKLSVHRAWRRQLPELHAALVDGLVACDVPHTAARCFCLELEPRACSATSTAAHGSPSAGLDAPAMPNASSAGLDAADVLALSELRLRFHLEWPLPLVISEASLVRHEQIFALLLQLRRARWALETASEEGASSSRHDAWHCAHPWLVLRAELLHFIAVMYSHLTLAVIQPEWQAFLQAVRTVADVDAFREAHEGFSERMTRRCLLRPRDEPILRAIQRILSIALRLRIQLEALPKQSAQVHVTSATRWRAELRSAVQFVVEALRHAADAEPRAAAAELLELCRLVDFNNFYAA